MISGASLSSHDPETRWGLERVRKARAVRFSSSRVRAPRLMFSSPSKVSCPVTIRTGRMTRFSKTLANDRLPPSGSGPSRFDRGNLEP